jgi:hypothetical protein
MNAQQIAHSIATTERLRQSLTAQDFQAGDTFSIKVSHYAKEIFTVTKVCADYIVCNDRNKRYDKIFFDNQNLEYYGDRVSILTRVKFNLDKLIQAQTELVATKVLFCGEVEGARWIKATEKAFTEVLENETIRFDGEVVGFVSRDSGKTRFVTKNGCSTECDCGGQISYHLAIFELLSRCHKSNVRQFPAQVKSENQKRMVA